MQCPSEIIELRKLWDKVFATFTPNNGAQLQMAQRYTIWLNYFETERAVCAKEGTVVENRNGVAVSSPHFQNMQKAEAEMRRLWKFLEKALATPKTQASEGFEEL